MDSDLPSLLLAAILASKRCGFLIVGSAGLRATGATDIVVHDLDIVIEPSEDNLGRLHDALTRLAIDRPAPSVIELREQQICRRETPYGWLDCMLERGRLDWTYLERRAHELMVWGLQILVADVEDLLLLRRTFKGDS